MQLSTNGRKLIQSFEGLSLKAYPDADGYSIGYGHFLGKDPALKSRVITREEAERLFDQDIVKFETGVSLAAPRATEPEFDAMVSLAYNIGVEGLRGSTVLRLHNAGDKQGAADAFRLWNKSRAKPGAPLTVNPVLVKRREQERSVYLSGGYSYSNDPGPATPLPPPPVAAPVSSLPPPSTSAWPTPGMSPEAIRTGAGISVGSLAALALGWLLYRLINR